MSDIDKTDKTLREKLRELIGREESTQQSLLARSVEVGDLVIDNADEVLRALHIQHVHDLIDQLGLAEPDGAGQGRNTGKED